MNKLIAKNPNARHNYTIEDIEQIDFNSLLEIFEECNGRSNSYYSKLENLDAYIIESNHDEKMLMDGPYPYILKQRVISDNGHLSNSTASEYLSTWIGDKTKVIILGHLSEVNNTKEVYDLLEHEVDVIFFDGNGYLHPRHMGIATHAGILINKATIGIAKSYYKIGNVDFVMPNE